MALHKHGSSPSSKFLLFPHVRKWAVKSIVPYNPKEEEHWTALVLMTNQCCNWDLFSEFFILVEMFASQQTSHCTKSLWDSNLNRGKAERIHPDWQQFNILRKTGQRKAMFSSKHRRTMPFICLQVFLAATDNSVTNQQNKINETPTVSPYPRRSYTQHKAAADRRLNDSCKQGSNHPSSLWQECRRKQSNLRSISGRSKVVIQGQQIPT